MAPPKGHPRYGGRAKGTPNRLTEQIKRAIIRGLETQTDKLGEWFDRVAAEDPGKALQLYGQLAEYAVPKLGRTEITGADGKSIVLRLEDE